MAHRDGFVGTDESSVVRWAGHPVAVVKGSPRNIKITTPQDLDIAERLLAEQHREHSDSDAIVEHKAMIRIGQGMDYHRLVRGRKLVLGGVKIPYAKGLKGHSDADVLCHAICDALLGAAALGDIGQHFPDSDPANRNRSSLEFLDVVRSKVEIAGWRIQNVDATLLVQSPRIGGQLDAMRQNIARSLRLESSDVSVKATTTEGLNAEGRGSGVSAHAVALLEWNKQ
jgi:2-C-methyl-D-erythritol 2,4-cyclodiphosphate synthase